MAAPYPASLSPALLRLADVQPPEGDIAYSVTASSAWGGDHTPYTQVMSPSSLTYRNDVKEDMAPFEGTVDVTLTAEGVHGGDRGGMPREQDEVSAPGLRCLHDQPGAELPSLGEQTPPGLRCLNDQPGALPLLHAFANSESQPIQQAQPVSSFLQHEAYGTPLGTGTATSSLAPSVTELRADFAPTSRENAETLTPSHNRARGFQDVRRTRS